MNSAHMIRESMVSILNRQDR